MEQRSLFKDQVAEILATPVNEGIKDSLVKAAKNIPDALKSMTGSDIFDTTGITSDKYNSSKKYYPNVSGFFSNKSTDKAVTKVLERINKLKTDKEVMNKMVVRQVSSPVTSQNQDQVMRAVQNYHQYIHTYLDPAIKQQNDALTRQYEIDKQTNPTKPPPVLAKLPSAAAVNTLQHLIHNTSDADANNDFKIKNLKLGVAPPISSGSIPFAIKWNMIQSREDAMKAIDQYVKHLQDTADTNTTDSKVDIVGENTLIPGISFGLIMTPDKKLKFPVDQWGVFLRIVEAHVSYMQRGFNSGFSTYDVLAGEARGERKRWQSEEDVLKSDRSTISPEVLQQFHKQIMTPLFLKTGDLLYLFPDQWEKTSSGGSLYRGVTGLGKQAYEAGKSISGGKHTV